MHKEKSKNHIICGNHEEKTEKEVKKHNFLVCACRLRKILCSCTTVRPWHLETLYQHKKNAHYQTNILIISTTTEKYTHTLAVAVFRLRATCENWNFSFKIAGAKILFLFRFIYNRRYGPLRGPTSSFGQKNNLLWFLAYIRQFWYPVITLVTFKRIQKVQI